MRSTETLKICILEERSTDGKVYDDEFRLHCHKFGNDKLSKWWMVISHFYLQMLASLTYRPSIMPVQEVMSSDPEDDQLKDDKPLHAQKQVAIEAEDVSIWDEEDP